MKSNPRNQMLQVIAICTTICTIATHTHVATRAADDASSQTVN